MIQKGCHTATSSRFWTCSKKCGVVLVLLAILLFFHWWIWSSQLWSGFLLGGASMSRLVGDIFGVFFSGRCSQAAIMFFYFCLLTIGVLFVSTYYSFLLIVGLSQLLFYLYMLNILFCLKKIRNLFPFNVYITGGVRWLVWFEFERILCPNQLKIYW